MKARKKELMDLYESYLQRNPTGDRKKCPSTKTILKLARLKLSKRRKSRVVNHIIQCNSCSMEYKIINDILKEEKKVIKDISKVINKEKKNNHYINPLISPNRRQYIFSVKTLLIASLLVVITISCFLLVKRRTAYIQRGNKSSVKIIAPIDKSYEYSKLVFQWDKHNAEYYIIDLFDETSKFLWRSNRIKENIFSPTLESAEIFKKGKRYFWMVTAYFKDGKKLESDLVPFSLK